MNPQAIDFEITDVHGRQHPLRAVNLEGSGWLLQACIDGRVFTHRCKDWQAVERTTRWMRARPADRRPAPASSEPGPSRVLVASVLLVVSILATSVGSAEPRASDDAGGIANANPETISRAIDAVAAVVRAERRDAKPGDLFNPAAQVTSRTRIDRALRSHGFCAAAARKVQRERTDN